MCDIALVKIHERAQYLFDNTLGLILWEAALILCLQVRVQALAHGVLHDQVDVLWRVNRLIQLDYIRMCQTTQYSDLSNSLFLALCILKLRPVVLLDGDLLSTRLMDAFFDNSVCTDTDLIAHMVHVQVVAVWGWELLRLQSITDLRISTTSLSEIGSPKAGCPVSVGIVIIATQIIAIISSLVLLHPAIEKSISLLVLKLLILECTPIFFKLSCKRVLCPTWMVWTVYDTIV